MAKIVNLRRVRFVGAFSALSDRQLDAIERRIIRCVRHAARVWTREPAAVAHKPRKKIRWYEWTYRTNDGKEFRCFRAVRPPEAVIQVESFESITTAVN